MNALRSGRDEAQGLEDRLAALTDATDSHVEASERARAATLESLPEVFGLRNFDQDSYARGEARALFDPEAGPGAEGYDQALDEVAAVVDDRLLPALARFRDAASMTLDEQIAGLRELVAAVEEAASLSGVENTAVEDTMPGQLRGILIDLERARGAREAAARA